MKFNVGDKVRILDGSKIPNYVGSWASHSMRGYVGDIDTVLEVHTYNNGSFGYSLNQHGYVWDERGLELVESAHINNCITISQDGELVTAKDEATGTDIAVSLDDEHKDFISASLYAHKKLIKEIRKNQPLGVKEVERLAKVGEYVKIVNADHWNVAINCYKNGDILKIIYIDGDGYSWYGHNGGEYLLPFEYVVLENYQSPVEEPKLYNHKVVCVKAEGCLTDHAKVGKIYEFVDGNCSNEVGGKFLSDPVHSIEELNNCFVMRNLRFIELKED